MFDTQRYYCLVVAVAHRVTLTPCRQAVIGDPTLRRLNLIHARAKEFRNVVSAGVC